MIPFLTMAKPYAYLAIALALVAVIGGAYLRGREDGANAEIASQSRQNDIVAVTRATAMRAAAEAIAQIPAKHTVQKNNLERQIIEKPVYRDCVADDDGLRIVNEGRAGAWTIPVGAVGLPAAAPSGF